MTSRGLQCEKNRHEEMIMENKRTGLKKIVGTVLILLFSMYTCRSLYLAFDKDSYSPIYAFLSLNIARLCVPLGCLFLLCERKVKQYDLVLVTLPLSYWLMQMVHSYGSYQGGGELTFLTSVIFVLLPTRVKKQIFQCVYQIIQLNNIISIILWIDFFLFNRAGFQRVLFYAQNGLETAYYYKFGIFAIYTYGDHTYRLCGIFNEPGALGTACALLFICTFSKTKWWEKLLLLTAGVLTVSFAFALLILGFVAVYLCQKKPSNIIYIIGIILMVFLVLPNIDFHNNAINELVGRFAITKSGLAGDNRTNSVFDAEYSNSIYYWFGMGSGAVLASGVASYKSCFMVPFGIVGTSWLLGSWLFAALKCSKQDKMCLIYVMLFFVSLYQRPYAIISIWGYIFLFGGIEWLKDSTNNIVGET